MKKLILTAVGVAMAATTAFGVPARRDWRTFTQTDGTTITVRLVGDENFHAYVTADGIPVERTADGNFRYITADGTTSAIAHDAANRDEAENSFVATNACTLKSLHQASMATPRRAREISKANENESQVPTLGAPRIPVLLLAYADYDFRDGKNAINTFTEFFESGDESARQYFVDQSNGKYTPQFDIYGPYTLSKNRSAYGGNIGDYDRGVGTMVGEGCQGLDNSIDFSKYDNDGDGECDVVIVIYAGDGEASSDAPDAANAVWPCQWELSSSDFGKSLRLDGVKVDKFGVFNELSGFDLSEIDGIGTFCHEFSHCLGLPDFYCTNDYSNYFGMSDWSLMDYGCYNNEGYTPIGYSAYEKNFMGWIDYVEPQDNTRYTLPVFNSKNAANDVALKITNPTNSNEYYIVENRARQGWDRYIYGEGLMITHVTYNASRWANNEVNNYSQQGMTIIPADNELNNTKASSLAGDLWPYNGNDALTDDSRPAATLNLGSQKFMGKPLTEMTRNSDGTISLWYVKGALPAVSLPEITSVNHTSTSITATWSHQPETDVTYSLQIRPHSDLESRLIFETDFTDEDHGWSTTGFTEVTADGLRLGSGKQLGGAISTSFTPEATNVTVSLNAKYYSGDESTIRVSVLNASGSIISSDEIPLTAQPETYNIVLDALAGQACKVRIESIAQRKRAYIISAAVYNGDATSELEAPARRAASTAGIVTVDGITGNSHTFENLEEGATYDIRIKAVPTTDGEYQESPWSAFTAVDLSGTSSIGNVITGTYNDEAADYFNLQGISVREPLTPGIYIRRTPSSVEKIIVR